MKKIASFQVNHDVLEKGFYVSRIDGDVVTYNIPMVRPNTPPFLANAAMHTFEHLFATHVRNSGFSDKIVYVGPMGCRTGFYFLTRDTVSRQAALDLFRGALGFIADFAGEIPGAASSAECGNWKEHDLPGAQAIARDMRLVLADWTPENMVYRA